MIYFNFLMLTFIEMSDWQPSVCISSVCQSFFLLIRRYLTNSILKDTLQLKILQIWIKIHANSPIKTLVDIIKPESKCLEIYHSQKIATPHFKEHWTKIDDISLVIIRFIQTNLVFINILDSFRYSSFTFLPFDF